MKKMIGNSPLFHKRYRQLQSRTNQTPRVPRRYKGEPPQHHSDLFTDENPRGSVHGLRFRNKKEAEDSVRRLKKLYRSKKITYAHLRQIGTTMEQRSRFHAHPTTGIRAGHSVWKEWNRSFLNKNYYRHSSKMAKHTSRRKRSHRRKLRSRYDEAENDMMEETPAPSYENDMPSDEDSSMDMSFSLYRRKKSRKGSKKSRKGSKKSRKGSKKSRKGSKKSRKGFKKSRKGSKKSRKGSKKSRKGSKKSRKGSKKSRKH
jgi:hypothetical protein